MSYNFKRSWAFTQSKRVANTGDLAALSAAVAAPSITPPTNPAAGQTWVSSALVDARVSHSFADRQPLIAPLTGEGSAVQEPSVWTDATYYYLLYTGGNGLCLRRCPIGSDPMVAANWTKFTGPGSSGQVIGNGAASIAGLVNHASVFQEGSTLYCYANVVATNTLDVFTASTADPTTWTRVGTVLASSLLTGLAANLWGNPRVVKDGSTYYLMQEYRVSATGQWQMAWATSSSPTSGFAFTTGTLTTLYPDTDHASSSGAWLAKENGVWTLVYHLQNTIGGLSQIYVATTPSLGADNFTIQHGAQPLVRRVSPYEIEQVADPEVLRMPNGQAYLFWSAIDNRNSTMRIMAQPLLPTRKVWNGNSWAALDALDDGRAITQYEKPAIVPLAGDFAGTATTFTDWPNMSVVWYPTGTEAIATFTAVVTASADGLYQFRMSGVDRSSSVITPALGGVDLVAGKRTAITFRCKLTLLQPFKYRPVKLQYLVPSGATLNCRPVAQAGIESATLVVEDATYRQVV
jgi:hypothetical protein